MALQTLNAHHTVYMFFTKVCMLNGREVGVAYLVDLRPEPVLESLLGLPQSLLGVEHVQVSQDPHHLRKAMDLPPTTSRQEQGKEVRVNESQSSNATNISIKPETHSTIYSDSVCTKFNY